MGPQEETGALQELAERAAVAPRHLLDPFFKESSKEVLVALARNPHLQERDLLRLLERKDLPAEAVREIAAHKEAARGYTVKLALARHPRTPRLITLPILKFLHLFDLLRVAQTPGVPADVKIVAEEAILTKAEALPRGEKITLARRGSGRVVAGLLATYDPELLQAGLGNPFLTEAHILKLLSREDLSPRVVETVAHHAKWSHRYHVRLALMRNPATPFQQVLAFLPEVAVNDLREICLDRRMPEAVRTYILNHCIDRLARAPRIVPPEA
jgi:hypothetical protein